MAFLNRIKVRIAQELKPLCLEINKVLSQASLARPRQFQDAEISIVGD